MPNSMLTTSERQHFQSMLTLLAADPSLIPEAVWQACQDRELAERRRRILEVDITQGGMEPEAYDRLMEALTSEELRQLRIEGDRFPLLAKPSKPAPSRRQPRASDGTWVERSGPRSTSKGSKPITITKPSRPKGK